MRASARSKGFSMQAARAMGNSDGGVISIRPRRGGPLAVVGHLSMYIQTETMSQSLIPTRGAACRREPLERARSNRRSHGGPAPAAGTLEYRKRKRTPVACRACRGRSRGARRCFKRSSGFARHAAKKNVPRFLLEKIPKETGERSFLGGMVSEPEFRRRAPRAPPGSFKGFMRTMPPVRWGAAMKVSFLSKGFL